MEHIAEKSPIDLMAELLAVMATRAADAERQALEYKKKSAEWYEYWQRKDVQLTDAQEKLTVEIHEHERTREALREAIHNNVKGAVHND